MDIGEARRLALDVEALSQAVADLASQLGEGRAGEEACATIAVAKAAEEKASQLREWLYEVAA